MKLHEKIKWARKKMGWDIARLALMADINPSSIRDVEARETSAMGLRVYQLAKIADALQRPFTWFLSDEEPDDPVVLHCKDSKG